MSAYGQQNKIKVEWGKTKHKATYISKHYQGKLKQFLSQIFTKAWYKPDILLICCENREKELNFYMQYF